MGDRPKITIADLAAECFILHPRHEGPIIYDRIVSLCQQAGFIPKIVQEALTNQTRISLVAAGVGITFVPNTVQNLMNGNVVYKTWAAANLKLELAAAWRVDNCSAVLRSFISAIEQFQLSRSQ